MRWALLLLAALLLAGCSAKPTGTLGVQVTDAPDAIGDFASLTVTVDKVTLTGADGKSVDVAPTRGTFDLTKLTNGTVSSLFEKNVLAGNYTRLTLDVRDASGLLKTHQAVVVKSPADTLFVDAPFDVTAGGTTQFVFDVQVHQEGNQNYIFQPNAGASGPR